MTEVLTYEALKAEQDALQSKCENLEKQISHINTQSLECALKMADAIKVLEERVNTLAVENAALKAINDDRRMFIMNGVQLGYIKVPTVEVDPALETIRIAVSPQVPTPATSAALAAIRLEAKIEGANELAERIAEMHSKTAPGSNIEKKLMFAAEAAIAYANGLREAK